MVQVAHLLEADQPHDIYFCKVGRNRSLPLNRYLFGVVLKKINDLTGTPVEELYRAFEAKFNIRTQTDLGEGEVVEYVFPAKKLKNKGFIEFIEKIRDWALHKLNLRIPLPNELSDHELIEAYSIPV